MAKKKIELPLIIGIILIIALVVVAIIFGGKKAGDEVSLENIADEIYGFSGVIEKIKDKTLTLDAWIPMADIEQNPAKAAVKTLVTDNTKIVRLKFPEDISNTNEPIYPEETRILFEDLKIGDKIDIGTADNISEKIKNKQEFEIKHIFIIE